MAQPNQQPDSSQVPPPSQFDTGFSHSTFGMPQGSQFGSADGDGFDPNLPPPSQIGSAVPQFDGDGGGDSKKKVALIAGAALAVLALVGGAAWFLLGEEIEEGAAPATAEATPAAPPPVEATTAESSPPPAVAATSMAAPPAPPAGMGGSTSAAPPAPPPPAAASAASAPPPPAPGSGMGMGMAGGGSAPPAPPPAKASKPSAPSGPAASGGSWDYDVTQGGPIVDAPDGQMVEVSRDSAFAQIYVKGMAKDGKFQIPNPPPGKVWWRVSGSQSASEIIVNDPPKASVSFSSPGQITSGGEISWNASGPISFYRVELAQDEGFAQISSVFSTTSKSLALKDVSMGSWYVRVGAYNMAAGKWEYSKASPLKVQ